MSTRKFTEEDIDEMVFLAKKYGSYRKAALEFGCSYQTVADRCHKRGVYIAGPHELCKKKKQLVIDGHTFYWIDKGYYRGSVNGERMTRTMVASSEDNDRHDLLNSYPVDGGIYLIAKKPA